VSRIWMSSAFISDKSLPVYAACKFHASITLHNCPFRGNNRGNKKETVEELGVEPSTSCRSMLTDNRRRPSTVCDAKHALYQMSYTPLMLSRAHARVYLRQ
jgi:hypothetical protein